MEEISSSPRLWWQLQSRIAAQKTQREKRRFFAWSWVTSAAFGALAIVFAVGAGTWFYNSRETETAFVPEQKIVIGGQDEIKPTHFKDETITPPVIEAPTAPSKISRAKSEKKSQGFLPKFNSARLQAAQSKPQKINRVKTEAATDFIALSYLPATESGQIVRVKVPRSMMVSLGVTTNTERNAELVNAEVIIADDGGARAIRFLK